MDIQVENVEGIEYMSTLQDNSIDLVLTDPPYIISKETGMNTHYNNVAENNETGIYVNTNKEWEDYKYHISCRPYW